MNVYVGTDSLKNAYIGEVWTPNANTLMYLPLESDATDHSGRSISTTPSNITYGTLGGVNCAISDGSSSIINFGEILYSGLTEGTVSLFAYFNGTFDTSTNYYRNVIYYRTDYGWVGFDVRGTNIMCFYVAGRPAITFNSTAIHNKWHHFLLSFDNTLVKGFLDGEKKFETSSSTSDVWGAPTSNRDQRTIFNGNKNTPNGGSRWKGGAREIIFEKKMWSDTKVTNYFNNIKSQYGIS